MQRLAITLLPLVLLTCAGCQQFQQISDLISGDTPGRYARLMEDSTDGDRRRIGVNGLVERDFARKPPYTTRYQQIAEHDPDPLVRATAVRALNRARDRSSTPLFVKILSDDNEWVRLEAVKALINMPDASAVSPLQKMLNRSGEERDVRIAAAEALKHYRTPEVARTLVTQLGERDFGIAWQAHRSLKRLTGRDLHYDESAWLNYLNGSDKPLG